MKKIIIFLFAFFIFNTFLSSQNYKPVIVQAGKSVLDYFPFQDRYRYTEFVPGIVIFKNGIYSETKLNYNLLLREIEFIKSSDTLAIKNPKDILLVIAGKDTFYYINGFIELISGDRGVRVAVKEYIKLREVLKKDPYGTSSSGSSRESFNVIPSETNYYKLKANTDLIFQRIAEYYISFSQGEFIPYRKKNVFRLFSPKKKEIRAYLKAEKVNFNSREDLLSLADFLRSL